MPSSDHNSIEPTPTTTKVPVSFVVIIGSALNISICNI